MTDSLVHIVNDTPFADSRLIAKGLGIDHHNFMQTAKKYQNEIESDFGLLLFETEVIKGRGQPKKFALLTEDQAITLAMLSKNTAPVVKVKIKLVKDFSTARKLLYSQSETSTPVSTSTDSTVRLYVDAAVDRYIQVQTMDDFERTSFNCCTVATKYREIQQKR